MSLPKYKYLLSYRYSEMIADLTVAFCEKFLPGFDTRRTREQMIQAARSGKQNIIEGISDARTSTHVELKLLGIANGSLEELLADYEDFLRQRNLIIWSKEDPKILAFRRKAYSLSHLSNLSNLGDLREKPVLPSNPEEAANFLITLCHQATYLLFCQIKAMEEKFIKEGGYTEKLLKERLKRRKEGKI